MSIERSGIDYIEVATYLVNIEQRDCGNLAGILKFVLFQQVESLLIKYHGNMISYTLVNF